METPPTTADTPMTDQTPREETRIPGTCPCTSQ